MAEPGLGAVLGAFGSVALIFGALWAVLQRRGRKVQVMALTWIASLVVTQLSMKKLTTEPFHFRFPALVTTMHFAVTWGVCMLHWAKAGDMGKCRVKSIGSTRRYARSIIPVACSLPLSVILNNKAMIYIGVAVNAVIGTLAPVVTAVLSHFSGRSLSLTSWSGVAMASVGAVVITWGESKGVFAAGAPEVGLFGFALSFTAVLCRSLKSVIQDQLLKPHAYIGDKNLIMVTRCSSCNAVCADFEHAASKHDDVDKPLEPLHLWALQGPPCCLLCFFCALSSESPASAWSSLTPTVVGVLLCTCISATLVNLLGMFTVKELGATSSQIVGKLNIIVTVSLSVSLLGERLAPEVLLGGFIVLCGVSIFEYGSSGHGTPSAAAAKLEPQLELPFRV